ncbi:MAG TPA: hypothetical protein VMQ52_03930 [Candidatus Saccharimonadales bacterium]|jgi:hypothetical protein|nr:hypothetical protein [Candidatus Saccharimonadales bacterium]
MRKIGDKYQTSGDITKLDGTPIPEDEPLLLFRAKDNLLIELLEHYQELSRKAGSPEEQINSMTSTIDEIKSWQANHQDRLGVPD